MKRLPALLTVFLWSTPAWAQAPTLTGIFPPGGQAGSTRAATGTGANLAEVQAVLVSGSGVRVEKAAGGSATSCPLTLTIAPDAEVGEREVRLVAGNGVSNGIRIWVGRYPDREEKEPNNALPQAEVLQKLPVTLNGQAEKAEDVDGYAFQAGAGETWVFSLKAAGYRSQLDGFLTLYDARGRALRSAMDNFERDPRLVYTFKSAGRYVIQARDSMYRGGPGYTYRLTLGKLPIVTRYTPMAGRRGTSVTVNLHGVNLESAAPVQVTLPADSPGEQVRVVPRTPLGPANPIDLFLTDMPVIGEVEPNDAAPGATGITAFPALVEGWIGRQGDRDLFRFRAAEKQPVQLEVSARRIGSRLDSVLRVLDSSGKALASNDDAVGKDSRLLFTPPATAEYYAEVRSLSERGGDDWYYRLGITNPPASDFRLALTPDNATVPAGAAVAVTVTAQRAGYNGEIALRVDGLPPGITASPVSLRQGQNIAVFTLSSAAGAMPRFSSFRVIGSARIGERVVERVAVGQERYQPPLTTQPQQARMRDTEMVVVAMGKEPPFSLAVTSPSAELKAGQKLELTIKATRKPEFKESVAVAVLGLPPGVTASALTLNKDQAEGKITLTAAANAGTNPAFIVVQGNGKNIVVAVPALPLTIQPAK